MLGSQGTTLAVGVRVSSDSILATSVPSRPRRTRLYGVSAPPPGQEDGLLPPGTRAGDYVIEGHLANGGMGSVYFAIHPLIGKRAAVKVLSAALAHSELAIARFLAEARAVNQIRHPNIVDIFAFGQLVDGRHYFVMEHLEGETLLDRMERSELPLSESADILGQICEALDAAHAHDIAHLDLKPENIFLVPLRDRKTQVKLLDFGIAKLLGKEQRESAAEFCGTPEYASPEQARGLSTVDHRSDMYSLGVVAYELFSGRRPFVATTPLETLIKHINEAAPPPSTLNAAIVPVLEQLLLAMLAKSPDERPSMVAVRETLAAVCPPAPVSGPIPLLLPIELSARPKGRRWMVGAGVASTAALAIGGIAGALLHDPVVILPSTEAVAAPRAAPAAVVVPPVVESGKPPALRRSANRPVHLVVPASVRAPGADYVLDYGGKRR